jgi:hypothetical protein
VNHLNDTPEGEIALWISYTRGTAFGTGAVVYCSEPTCDARSAEGMSAVHATVVQSLSDKKATREGVPIRISTDLKAHRALNLLGKLGKYLKEKMSWSAGKQRSA